MIVIHGKKDFMNEHLNILMISHFPLSMAYARPHCMGKYLVKKGHRVTLLVTAEQRKRGIKKYTSEGVQIIESPDLLWGKLRRGMDLWNTWNRIRILRQENESFDVIHCFETRPTNIYPALDLLRRSNALLVTDWNDWWGRGGIIQELRPAWYRILFEGIETYYEERFRSDADGLTVISTALARRARDMGIPEESICHISGGALPKIFLPRSVEECRKKVGIDLTGPIIGYSSFAHHVELDFMMQSLALLAKKYADIKLLITGRTNKLLNKIAKDYNVEQNLILTGFVSYELLPWYMGCANLFVLPFPEKTYNIGRWPNKIGDYISLGRPTVTNPVGDLKPLFEEHEIGLLSRWDPIDFSEKVISIIENPNLAKKLGQNARQVALDIYDWEFLADKLESFYYRLLNEKGKN